MATQHDLSGDDIRAIRLGLGLTQVEAGEVIGGGPRAFAKYEAGTVLPSASVRRLLRLLQADPAALGTLRGNGRHSRPAAATGPFAVAGDHVASLTERRLPELLRQLLSAEAQANNLPLDRIHVASNILAPDGGEDGHITWTGGPDRTPFLPSRTCQFQLKVGGIAPSVAGREVLTGSGDLKDMVRSELQGGAHYILLTTHRYARKAIEHRAASILEAIRSAGLHVAAHQIQVRDADQIADWVNSHPAVATWLREQTRPGTSGPFRSWNRWAERSEHERSPWVDDERLPRLRDWLLQRGTESRSSAHVVGRVGVGKSRLVHEALSPGEENGTFGSSPSDLVLYAVEFEVGPQAIFSAVQSLADAGTSAVIVVDSCTTKTRAILTGMVSRQSSQASLITISDHVPDEAPDRATFTVDQASPSVIEAILARTAPALPPGDSYRLVRFSNGLPEIAIRIGQTWGTANSLARATDADLLDAYVLGQEADNRGLLLKSARLLAAFGAVRVDPPEHDQLAVVAGLGSQLTEADLRLAVDELTRRSAFRRRGGLVVSQPLPIALKLADRQWHAWSPAEWDLVLTGSIDPDLQIRAAKQLAFLNEFEISHQVLDHVCRTRGPLEGLGGITARGRSEILTSLAEIDAECVGRRIRRSLRDAEDLGQITGTARRHLVRALKRISFHPEAFDIGAELLLRLAAAESEACANNATEQFAALFPLHLANTAADGETRLLLLDEAATIDEEGRQAVIVGALVAGCETRHFMRMMGPGAHGSRPALESWVPPTGEAAKAYITGCVERLTRFAMLHSSVGGKARAELGRRLGSLIGFGLLDVVESAANDVLRSVDVWPEAVESLGSFLALDGQPADEDVVDRVKSLLAALQPHRLQSRARFLITYTPRDYLMSTEDDFEIARKRQREAMQTLASEFLAEPAELIEVLSELSHGQQRAAFDFGEALAELSDPPHAWLEPLIAALIEHPASSRNFSLFCGYVIAVAKGKPAVAQRLRERIAHSRELAPALPVVCWNLGISPDDIQLAIGAIHRGYLDPRQLSRWGMGGVLAKLPVPAVAGLLDELFEYSAEAFAIGLDLIGMYAYRRLDVLEELRPQVLRAAERISQWDQVRGETMGAHHFQKVMTWILTKGRQDPDAPTVALTLSRAVVDCDQPINDSFIQPLLPRLLSDFPEISWSLIGQAIVSDRRQAWRLEFVLGSSLSVADEANPVILRLPEEALFAWCHAHPDTAPAFSAAVLPVLAPQSTETPQHGLHPVMARLLDLFGDRQPVLDALARNICSFGWRGSVVPYFARYEEPLQTLFDHHQVKVRIWARRMLDQVRLEMDRYRIEDEEFEAQGELYG